MAAAAKANDLPPALLHAVIHAESRYNPNAAHPAAPPADATDAGHGEGNGGQERPRSALQRAGRARYLKRMLTMFDNDITLAVAAYNAGPDAVMRRGGIVPPYAETQRYVPKVLRQYRRLQGLAMDARCDPCRSGVAPRLRCG